jgi:CRP/FNR family cyclic AMP-dependent transcriptional regulator
MAERGSNGRLRVDPSARRLSLARAAPDLGAGLPPDRQPLLEQISVAVVSVGDASSSVSDLLERFGAFAAIVVDGLVLHDVAVGGEPGVRVLGPGDVIGVSAERPTVLERSSYRATPATELAILGYEFLNAAHREPILLLGLHAATVEQTERLAAQLVICQMPRVADRVLAMMWLLADSFGRVTPAGTRLRLSLTHELLGAMVGARRPTVTLALGELSKRGAVVHQDGSWLLLEPAPSADGNGPAAPVAPELLDPEPSQWAEQALESAPWDIAPLTELEETISRLHVQHQENVVRTRERLTRVAQARRRSSELLAQTRARRERFSPKPPPSSG